MALLVAQRDHGIDTGGTPGRQPGGEQRHAEQEEGNRHEGHGVVGVDAEQQALGRLHRRGIVKRPERVGEYQRRDDADADAKQGEAHALTHDESLKALAVSLHGSGDRNGGTLTGSVDANAHRVLLDPLRFALAEKLLTIETLHLRSPEAVGTLNASGKIRLDGTPLGGDLTIAWDGVELPADLVGQVLATQGSIDASGNAQRFTAKGDLSIGPRGKPARVAVELDGTPQAIALRRLELKQPNGGMTASGEVALKPQPGWKLEAKANRLDPGAFAAQWPGALSFDVATSGTVEKDGAHGRLRLDRLSGTLRQRSVSGNGDLAFAPPLSIDGRLEVASGNSHVAGLRRSHRQ